MNRSRALWRFLVPLSGLLMTASTLWSADCNQNGVDDSIDITTPQFLDFGERVDSPVGGISPFSLAAGDFDEDGDLDVAVGILLSNTVEILENDGSGRFVKTASLSAGVFPAHVTAGDFNADGHLDLAAANRDSDNVSVFLNEGDGSFAAQSLYDVGSFPLLVATGDLDGDGRLDLVVSNRDSNNVSVLMNEGDGTFAEQDTYPAGTAPFSLTVGDLDNDGDLDLAVSNITSMDISVLWNDGSGAFSSPIRCSLGTPLLSVTSADFDGDGRLDLAVTQRDSSKVSVLRNIANEPEVPVCPFLLPPADYAVGEFPYSVTAEDWDEDGDVDLAVANYLSPSNTVNTVSLLENDGTGEFAETETLPAGTRPTFVTFGDVDGDRHLDMVVANDGTETKIRALLSEWAQSEDSNRNGIPDDCEDCNRNGILDGFEIAFGLSDDCNNNGLPDECDLPQFSSFGERVDIPVRSISPFSLAAGDFDEDGDLDLAVGLVWAGALDMLENDGSGRFVKTASLTTGVFPAHVTAGDFNADGHLDLAAANRDSDNVSVFLNEGDGSFAGQSLYDVGSFPLLVATGDLDGDGRLDLVVSNRDSNNVSVLMNEGDGTFAEQDTYPAGTAPFSLTVGDLDNDGDLDLAVSNITSMDISVLWNDGSGVFSSPIRCSLGTPLLSVTSADFDGDGRLDLAVTQRDSSKVSVLRNIANEPEVQVCPFALPPADYAVREFPYSVTAEDWDEDGDVDLAVANHLSPWNTVSLLENDGTGEFAETENLPAGPRPTFVTFGDVDGDRHLDMVVANDGTDRKIPVLLSEWTEGERSDCNRNGVPDECDISADASQDCNENSIPDECEPPLITIVGPISVTVECGTDYEDPGATAEGTCAGDLTDSIAVTSTVDTSAPGSYTVAYTVTDPIGSETTAQRTVDVVDTAPPEISCPEAMTVEHDSDEGAVVEFAVVVLDDCDAGATVTSSPPSGSTFNVGTTIVTSTATDASGNTSECSFEVTVVSARFLRGDCNDDTDVDLSDAVCILSWLFLGRAAPSCVAASNVNGDEAVDLSDPVSLLSHLFLGGRAPAPPFPGCGTGNLAADEQLGCKTPPKTCP